MSLILGGGSIRGAFQAGALSALIEQGETWDALYGVSVGALNLLWVADRVGRGRKAGLGADEAWRSAGVDLLTIWRERITGPEALGEIYDPPELARSIALSRWEGLMNISRLAQLLNQEVEAENVIASGLRLSVGCTDVDTGAYLNVTLQGAGSLFLQYAFASALTPIVMPTVEIAGQRLTDGGLRHVLPVDDALAAGDTSLTVIACQQAPENRILGRASVGTLPALISRAFDIMTIQIVEADLAPLANDPSHRIIRPPGRTDPDQPTPLEQLNDIADFTPEEVRNLLDHGRETVLGTNRV